jgi:hypothetical protein
VTVGWGRVILCWVVLAGLVAEYWLVERPHARRVETAPARPRFVHVRPGDVREVRLSREGRTVVSRRQGSAWAVVEPAGTSIPPDLLGAFANALTEAEEIAHVAGADADPEAFGLDARATRVEITGERGDPVVVTIGSANPTGTAVYARRDASPDVVLIGRNVRYYEDLIFQALSAARVPAADGDAPVGG